jgi:hypothetical protein
MKRATLISLVRSQKNDTTCFSTLKGRGKRAKRQGAKRLRQYLAKDLTYII